MGLVLVLISSLVGGLAFSAIAGGGPSLKATVNPGVAPGNYTFSGSSWSYPGQASLYMDAVDPAQLVATATVSTKGIFVVSVMIPATTLGVHHMIAVQGLNQVGVPFTITSTPPTDSRSQDILTDIQSQVNNEDYGLEEIKLEVKDIQDQVNNKDYGLEETKNEIKDIEKELSFMAKYITHIQLIEPATYNLTQSEDTADYTIYESELSPEACHVSVTLAYSGLSASGHSIQLYALVGGYPQKLADWNFSDDPAEGVVTLDFNTEQWYIVVTRSGAPDINIGLDITTTYRRIPV